MNPDISRLLDEWDYTGPDKLIVRKFKGDDGRTRIQMRVDLGILQMEWSNRPDGQRPHGKASLLDHFLEKLEQQKADKGPDAQLNLSHEGLREPADGIAAVLLPAYLHVRTGILSRSLPGRRTQPADHGNRTDPMPKTTTTACPSSSTGPSSSCTAPGREA